jgi:hypothetical protein
MDSPFDPAMGHDACHRRPDRRAGQLRERYLGCRSSKVPAGRRRFLFAGAAAGLISPAAWGMGPPWAHAQQSLPKADGSASAGNPVMAAPIDTVATLQAKLNSVPVGGTLVFPANSTFDFNYRTVKGRSGVTLLANGPVTIDRGPGPGTAGAFDFGGMSDWTIRGALPGQGFVFNKTLINADDASHCAVGNSVFDRQPSNDLGGSAIRMSNTSFMLVINNDFKGVQGSCLAQYNWDNITIDGNHFVDCFNPISVSQGNDRSRGRNIRLVRNVVLGMVRSGFEMTGDGEGVEGYFSNLLIDNNWFADISAAAATAQYGTGPVSIVALGQVGTRITNNFFRVGPYYVAPYTEAVEFATKASAGEISGNLIVDFTNGITLYERGADVHGNMLSNTGGGRGNDKVLRLRPRDPPRPARIAW